MGDEAENTEVTQTSKDHRQQAVAIDEKISEHVKTHGSVEKMSAEAFDTYQKMVADFRAHIDAASELEAEHKKRRQAEEERLRLREEAQQLQRRGQQRQPTKILGSSAGGDPPRTLNRMSDDEVADAARDAVARGFRADWLSEDQRAAANAYLRGGAHPPSGSGLQMVDPLATGPRAQAAAGDRLTTGDAGSAGILVPTPTDYNVKAAEEDLGTLRDMPVTTDRTTHGQDKRVFNTDYRSRRAEVHGEGKTNSKEDDLEFKPQKSIVFTYRTPKFPITWEEMQDVGPGLIDLVMAVLAYMDERGFMLDALLNEQAGIPLGVVPQIGASLPATNAASITWQDSLKLQGEVGSSHRGAGIYAFNWNTYLALRSIERTDSGAPLFTNDGIVGGAPPRLHGRPYRFLDDLDDVGADKTSMLYGRFSSVTLRDCVGQAGPVIVRHEYPYKDDGATAFAQWSRHGVMYRNPGDDPLSKLTHPSA